MDNKTEKSFEKKSDNILNFDEGILGNNFF